MTTTITFHAGTHTSGGTVIAVQHGTHRVLFDFGFPFDPTANVFDGEIAAGGPGYLSDLLQLGMLPPIDGVFSRQTLGRAAGAVQPAEDSAIDTIVLVSHPHEDHVGGIGLLDESVPVYLSDDGAALMRALAALGQFSLPRDIDSLPVGEDFEFGPFRIRPYYSDHPAWGSVGFLITTPDGTLYWSGDFRLHGRERQRVLSDLAELRATGVDLLILEGSSAGSALPGFTAAGGDPEAGWSMPDGLLTEEQVDDEIGAVMAAPGVVFANIYPRDFSPILGILRMAREAGRQAAVQPDLAYILEQLTGELPAVYLTETNIGNGAVAPSDAAELVVATPGGATRGLAFSDVERDVLARATIVNADDVLADPDRWLVQVGYRDTRELLRFDGVGGVYLHLGGTPLGTSGPQLDRLRGLLDRLGLDYSLAGRHVHFAHAMPSHLRYFVRAMAPKNFVAVHSLRPHLFTAPPVPKVKVRPGTVLQLSDGVLVTNRS